MPLERVQIERLVIDMQQTQSWTPLLDIGTLLTMCVLSLLFKNCKGSWADHSPTGHPA